jgi:tetratricopeptide (TPR) repeat protein/transcriptional regulator with XRE-family HTH domain
MAEPNQSGVFGKVIKRLLKEKNLSQNVFSIRAKLTPDYVSKLVNGGIVKPRDETRRKIAEGLGITEEKLEAELEREKQKLNSPPVITIDADDDEEEQVIDDNSPLLDRNFVGRENAIAHLNTRIRQGSKIILIQAAGGIGKTTLAEQFLYSQGFELVLKLPMAKEKENIRSVESVIEGWLTQDLKEEPGREFWVSLERLKRQLQSRKIGVFIDNLEPALDGQGQFIEPHRAYIELLRMLADPMVQSVTLITSRERLCEPNVTVERYGLQGLDDDAWQQFFTNSNWHIDIDRSTLNAMHKAFGGNAKAMGILCGAIREDFDGDMVAYWQENNTDPLAKTDLKNLVTNQFNRLQELNSNAYKLLCRLGCYRYQDVPTVPTEGLLCLLWDVPEGEKRRVIESLRDRSLVEFKKGEYWLHPVIRAEAISRLRESEDWEIANTKAAEFWTESIKTVETIKDALTAFEAYYHYLAFNNTNDAANVIVQRRASLVEINTPLGCNFYRLGLLQPMKLAITKIINQVNPGYTLSRLHNILGDIYWLTGDIKNSIKNHDISRIIATDFKLIDLEIVSFFNIGLCQIDLLEIKKGIALFEKVISMAEDTEHHRYVAESYFCLAFLKSCLDLKHESLKLADKSSDTEDATIWTLGYRLWFLGQTYKNLKLFDKSFEMYREAIQFAEKTHYTQVRAKALYGLAELYRIQGECETALSHHLEAIELLDKIGAKCDLADAYYQLGLTYQKMGEIDKSQENFDNAIKLFEEMEAPKQVEKVRQAIGKSDAI